MKLATLKDGSKDGRLVIVSRDLTRAADATAIAPTLLAAVESWSVSAPRLQALSERLNEGRLDGAFDFDPRQAAAPLPRAPQWCDGSAFLNHGALMQQAFKLPPIADIERIPLMYQGGSDDMLGPHDDIAALDEAHGIDFEGEFGVIVGDVPMGVSTVGGWRTHPAAGADQRRQPARVCAARDADGFRLLSSEAVIQLRARRGHTRRAR